MIINIHTNERQNNWPNQVGATLNATREQAEAAGWRDAGEPPAVQAGYTRISDTWSEAGGWQVVDRLTAEIEAERAQAKLALLTPELIQAASVYRTAMHRNFGVGSEVDTTITKQFVEQYFAGRAACGIITTQEIADSQLLSLTFPVLEAWTGDGTAWTFPWSMVP